MANGIAEAIRNYSMTITPRAMSVSYTHLKPEECLVLEDSEAGLRAGIALGGAIIYIPDIAIVPEQVTAKVTETLADLGKVIGWLEAHRCNAK